MAGMQMTSTEIWLRLIYTGDLFGEGMLRAAQSLANSAVIDAETLTSSGLTAKQARRFLAMSSREIEESLLWLEQPQHHLILACEKQYPPQLRALADYPGALFI